MEVHDFILRILAGLGMGVIIGLERQFGQHPAGVRTNALVSLGAALFVCLSASLEPATPTRIAGQVVTGIGFICGGAILREGITVRGMNTAATLWCTAAIGTLCGLGYWNFGLLGTVAILLAHLLFRPIAHAIDRYNQGNAETELLYDVKLICQRGLETKVRALLLEQIKVATLRLQGLSIQNGSAADHVEIKVHLFALQHNEQAMNDLVACLAALPEVSKVSWGKAS